jgi:hypothetical protein
MTIPAFGADASHRKRLTVRHRLELPADQCSYLAAVKRGKAREAGQERVLVTAGGGVLVGGR